MAALAEHPAQGPHGLTAFQADLARRLHGLLGGLDDRTRQLLAMRYGLDGGAPPPALVIGMPVGFVNAAESKALLQTRADVPWITIKGRKGGSALAGATVNALAIVLRAAGSAGKA